MILGATLGWPTLAVLGFVLLTGVVVALGTTSTARYEFERNRTRERQRMAAGYGVHPAGSRQRSAATGETEAPSWPHAVEVAVRPVPAPATGGPGWWLVDDAARILAGPFADQFDADWAALAEGLPAVSVFGARRDDGSVAPKPSPEERAWLAELGTQLDRLPREWDALLTDTDPLTTLVVEIAAALVEIGLPLREAAEGHPSGGVSLMPEPAVGGVVVSWRTHDRMSRHHSRGAAADATVSQSMNAVIADVLANLGFVVEPFGAAGSSLVTALR